MSLELDKRIKAITDIKSVTDGCHDWELMTKKGYFANSIFDFKDLSTCAYGEYAEYREHDQCFLCEIDHYDGTFDHAYYGYFIPEDALKPEEKPEKKYRPYKDVEEFFDDVGCTLGDVIRFRKKDTTEEEYHTLLTGFKGNARVNIGLGDGGYYSLSDLFSLFELYTSDGWRPFGIKE